MASEKKIAEKKSDKKAAEIKGEENPSASPSAPPRLKETYRNQVIPAMQKEFGYKNIMQVPRLEKVVINMGVGAAGQTGGNSKFWMALSVT